VRSQSGGWADGEAEERPVEGRRPWRRAVVARRAASKRLFVWPSPQWKSLFVWPSRQYEKPLRMALSNQTFSNFELQRKGREPFFFRPAGARDRVCHPPACPPTPQQRAKRSYHAMFSAARPDLRVAPRPVSRGPVLPRACRGSQTHASACRRVSLSRARAWREQLRLCLSAPSKRRCQQGDTQRRFQYRRLVTRAEDSTILRGSSAHDPRDAPPRDGARAAHTSRPPPPWCPRRTPPPPPRSLPASQSSRRGARSPERCSKEETARCPRSRPPSGAYE
jgi:hypothetical protein